jgi:hypothetical protein
MAVAAAAGDEACLGPGGDVTWTRLWPPPGHVPPGEHTGRCGTAPGPPGQAAGTPQARICVEDCAVALVDETGQPSSPRPTLHRRLPQALTWPRAAADRRRRRSLTKADTGAAPSPDLMGRDFTADRPGTKMVGDVTCIPAAQGWLCLASWLAWATREIIGYRDSFAVPRRSRRG